MTALRGVALAAALISAASPARAEVLRITDGGFAVGRTVTAQDPPAEVWARLVRPAQWWSAEHTWSGEAANLLLEAKAGACFCETLPGGGSVEHMRVIHAAPGRLLRMVGTLGPLQAESLTGVLSVELNPQGTGTRIVWSYKVSGVSDVPLATLAPVVEGVVGQQFARLAAGPG
ncbi:SRPBCC family protein [Tsuneonella sp. HG222]